jgi:hypothetical protein
MLLLLLQKSSEARTGKTSISEASARTSKASFSEASFSEARTGKPSVRIKK